MKKNKGYSLLEVLVAFSILTIAMIPILSMYPLMFKMSRRAGTSEEYARLSLSIIDYIKSRGYNNLKDNSTVIGVTTTYAFTPTNGAFYAPNFEGHYGIPSGFFLVNSKEGNLTDVKMEVKISKDYFEIKDSIGGIIEYYSPVSGEKSTDGDFNLEVLTTEKERVLNFFLVGEIKIGKDDGSGSISTDGDYSTTFVVSPIENW